MLEAPDDVYSLRWHPNNPHLLCAGCFNGQLALWDLRKHRDKLKDDGSLNEQVFIAECAYELA